MKLQDKLIDNSNDTNTDQFHIVGIGTSAGGLEALDEFFLNMPENTGMAFIVIQHLAPDHKGILSELIQRVTKMKVFTVSDRMKVKPNCVYVIPSNKSMSIYKGTLHLFKSIKTNGLRLPIDFFFRSLAEDQHIRSVGIIFSGMGSDGSMGLKAIKEKSGLVMVQDPETAKFDSMPRHAIDSVVVDIVAPANEIPSRLIGLVRQPPVLSKDADLEKDTSALDKVIILLRNHTGNDFSEYKKNTIYRRIERRMGIHQLKKISSYVRYLQETPAEVEILFKELLIGVTGFFRDPALWDELRDKIFPSIFEKLPRRHVLRVWTPGCSTGEEAYSMAIVFKEALEKANLDKNISLQIFATDLDKDAIEKARKGIYPSNIITDVSSGRLIRFFTKTDDHYKVNPEIREMVVFASQNLIKDPPFTKLNIVSCRNLLIYMDSALQKRLLSLFHYTLITDGYLLLGSAETNGTFGNLFTAVNSKLRIYQRTGISIKEDLSFQGASSQRKPGLMDTKSELRIEDNIQVLTDQILLQQYSPASVLATNKGDILYLTGDIGKYLAPAAGKANMNLFAMAREGLRNELPAAFRKALQSFEKVVLSKIKIGSNGRTRIITASIQQLENPPTLKNKILVVFSDVPDQKARTSNMKKGKTVNTVLEEELTQELLHTKEELESTREEMQTSQEELKSTNEELQSTNEELQSANEELTTSKEEMQSMNEELQTMNVELQSKIDDSVRINNDMKNLLNSIEIATLFLDKELNIRQYTMPAIKIFKLKQSDIGRQFTDQVTDLEYPEMLNDAKEVLRSLIFIEKPVCTRDGRWFNIRIMPYRTFEDKIDGLVITFINITESKYLEQALKKSQKMFHSLVKGLPIGIICLSANGLIIEINNTAKKLLGYDQQEFDGINFFTSIISRTDRKKVEEGINGLLTNAPNQIYENSIKDINGNLHHLSWSAYDLTDDQNILVGIIKDQTNI